MPSTTLNVAFAFVAAFFFFLAVGYSGWPCSGSILAEPCSRTFYLQTTGAILLTAGLVVFVGAIILILVVTMGDSWTEIVSAVLVTIAAILSIAGVFYYLHTTNQWSPFFSTIAMTLTVALASMLLYDLISSHT
ncbi:unnamed protein product [Mesocestoides corti]|uniref:Expressed conserved protein n=1 Tax=Mesocestoides corti TaxID=53468 RepID=A0A0R3ULR1_MESCO|nr:unnamed protein product [Mesocestoides corti]